MYAVIKIITDGQIIHETSLKAPTYEVLREFVGGLIQYVPHLTKFENYKRGQMVVNEEELIHNLPYNQMATIIWLDNLGKGPFSYPPELYGNAIYWAKIPK